MNLYPSQTVVSFPFFFFFFGHFWNSLILDHVNLASCFIPNQHLFCCKESMSRHYLPPLPRLNRRSRELSHLSLGFLLQAAHCSMWTWGQEATGVSHSVMSVTHVNMMGKWRLFWRGPSLLFLWQGHIWASSTIASIFLWLVIVHMKHWSYIFLYLNGE